MLELMVCLKCGWGGARLRRRDVTPSECPFCHHLNPGWEVYEVPHDYATIIEPVKKNARQRLLDAGVNPDDKPEED